MCVGFHRRHVKQTIMILKKLRTFAIISLMSLSAIPVVGQDLLARQAPVDRRMMAVDTFQLRKLISKEQAQSPSSDLYEDFSNKYAHHETALPDSFRISLRDFCMPTPSRVVTSNFGSRWGRMHKGLDIKVYIGDTIRAAFSGKVRVVRYEGGGYGNYIVIRHPNGLETIYGHLSKQLVEEDEEVKAGEPIGLGGNTGRSTGSHLHFETRLCGVALNPALMFDFRNQDVTNDYYTFRKSSYDRESLAATKANGKIGNGGYSKEEVVGTPTTGEPMESGFVRYHKVKSGETLYTIARKRGVSVETICDLNHLGKEVRLRPGQIIRYS